MPIRWGIAGPGGIAERFASSMADVEGGEIVAVASRSAERADAFADRFDIPQRYGSYEDLAAADLDVVYVATTQQRHRDDVLLYVGAGKHVLCEKPMTMNAAQTTEVVAAARAARVFLMEAIWSRFLPYRRVVLDALGSGRIGDPLLVEADFGFALPVDVEHRLFDPGRGGGALLDLGVYPVELCAAVLGHPTTVDGRGWIGETGVDETVAAVLGHGDGRFGVVKASITRPMACTARIAGTAGWIELPAPMHCPDRVVIVGLDGRTEVEAPWTGGGLQGEIEEVHRCLADGLTESPSMRLADSLAIAGTLDSILASADPQPEPTPTRAESQAASRSRTVR